MTINEFFSKQRAFDSSYEILRKWSAKITYENPGVLEYLVLAATGEMGEVANLTKKIIRGDAALEESREALTEEITDVFIYLLKLIDQLDIDIEKSYDEKMKRNAVKYGRLS